MRFVKTLKTQWCQQTATTTNSTIFPDKSCGKLLVYLPPRLLITASTTRANFQNWLPDLLIPLSPSFSLWSAWRLFLTPFCSDSAQLKTVNITCHFSEMALVNMHLWKSQSKPGRKLSFQERSLVLSCCLRCSFATPQNSTQQSILSP